MEDTSEHSDKNTPPSPLHLLEELLTIVRDVRTRTKMVRKSPKLLKYKGRRKLAAVRAARTERVSIGCKGKREVASPPTSRSTLHKGRSLYRLLTDTAGRDVEGFGKPIVTSRLIPISFKRRELIGAVMQLQNEVANGMALALEVPVDKSTTVTDHNGEPVSDEHLNLVRDYQVGLHTKLVEPEENRTHMSTYIHFEEDAPGDDEILGETDMNYFIEYDDTYPAESKSSAGMHLSTNRAIGEVPPHPAHFGERQVPGREHSRKTRGPMDALRRMPRLSHRPRLSPRLSRKPRLSPRLSRKPRLSPRLSQDPRLSPRLSWRTKPYRGPGLEDMPRPW